MASREVCALCKSDEGQMNVVSEKGLKTMLRASQEKEKHDIYDELTRLRNSEGTVLVHHDVQEISHSLEAETTESQSMHCSGSKT